MNQTFLDFVRYSIHSESEAPKQACSIDWNEFIAFCNRQGVLGIVFEGLQRADVRMPPSVLYQWLSYSESIKSKNIEINHRIEEIQRYFKEKGYRTCILKGQANGLMYPIPEVRSPGDIDIWVDGKAEDLIKLIQSSWPEAPYSLHHIKMPVFKDVSVEVHYRPTGLSNWRLDKKLQHYIGQMSDSQFTHKEMLGGVEICCLTDGFNALYQILHMYGHFFATRNSLKQYLDYYYLLKKGIAEEEKRQCLQMLKILKLDKFASGVMWIMKDVLGLEERYLIGEINDKEGKRLLKESFCYGTFSDNKLRSFLEQTMSNCRLLRHYPQDVLLSPVHLLWHQWWKFKMKQSLKK